MGKFYARSEDAVEDFWAVLQWVAENNRSRLSNREIVERTLNYFYSLQRGIHPEDYAKNRERNVAIYKRRQRRFYSEGLCTVCVKRKAVPGLKRCQVCRDEAKRRRIEYAELAGAVAYKKEQEAMACTL